MLQPDSCISIMKKDLVYIRMLFGGLIGFAVFFIAVWLYLKLSGIEKNEWNPYAGAPNLVTSLFIASIGSVIGAIAGIFKKR